METQTINSEIPEHWNIWMNRVHFAGLCSEDEADQLLSAIHHGQKII